MSEAADQATIVIGYDGSDAARRALSRAERLGLEAMHVVLVTVTADVRSPALGDPLVESMVNARQLLDEARDLFAPPGHAVVETQEAAGDPAVVLVDIARELDAELVIIGRRGSDFVARTLLGSVAERVVEHAPCDVLVVA